MLCYPILILTLLYDPKWYYHVPYDKYNLCWQYLHTFICIIYRYVYMYTSISLSLYIYIYIHCTRICIYIYIYVYAHSYIHIRLTSVGSHWEVLKGPPRRVDMGSPVWYTRLSYTVLYYNIVLNYNIIYYTIIKYTMKVPASRLRRRVSSARPSGTA